MVRLVAETAVNSSAGEVIVVTGHDAKSVAQALDGLDVRLVHNPDHEDGMSSSLKTGVQAVGGDHAGAAIMLGDMPRLKVETLNQVIARFKSANARSICAPVCGSRRGNPVIWPREFFSEICALSGDKGARDLIKKYGDRVLEIPCDDDGVLIDVDTPDDIV